MALGTTDFTPGTGDLVKLRSARYLSIPKGTVALVRNLSDSGTECFLEGYNEPVTRLSDLEILSYNKIRPRHGQRR